MCCYHFHGCFLFCSGNRMGSNTVDIRDIVRETQGCCVIFSPACPHSWPLHSPASGFYPPLTPPGPYHLLLIHPQGVLIVLVIWKQSISRWICGLSKAQFGGGMQHLALFCHLVRYQVCLGSCVWFVPRISTHTPSPLSRELPENRGHVWTWEFKSLNSHIGHRLWHIVRR